MAVSMGMDEVGMDTWWMMHKWMEWMDDDVEQELEQSQSEAA
jgi:hypothetical protein